jgi:hypothetical protein
MTIKAKYTISEQVYLDSQKLYSKVSSKAAMVLILFAVISAMIGFWWVPSRAILLGGLIGGCISGAFIYYLVIPMRVRRYYQKYKAIQEEFEIELLEDGLNLSSRNGSWLVRWDQAIKWREDAQFVLIYPMPRLYHIVPKQIASQGFDVELLRSKLTSHLGTAV